MKQVIKWHNPDFKLPKGRRHIIAELDDYTIASGDSLDGFEGMKFIPDNRPHVVYDFVEILRWAYYPEAPLDEDDD